ncbi:RNA polymerase II subunit A C-terminal domain phosphatase [Papilio machaon]|uniref:RNA polymerase II subunit A C-terminal domain phosphatase n=1 Tax=Papilio machaon TaxID=76193 RepID=A0A0N0PBY7_PAPMA|nr:RNA polymerase II subunit A C-terminal domain phosphatase [Papilio machaon]
MAEKTMPIFVPSEKPLKVIKWKVKQGAVVSHGQILFLYSDSSGKSSVPQKFKAACGGTILSIKVKEGDIAEPGGCVAELKECKHSTVMKEMCAECGSDLRKDERVKGEVASVPMVHSVPELKVSEELALKLGREDAERHLRNRKLVLLVDLDQTLVHTTNDNIPPNLKDVLHFFLRGPGNTGRWCHTRLRPRTKTFLESASKKYELHVCTFGARQYAHAVTELLDPEKKYFSHRILSRDEFFDARTKSANLKALFPCGDNMVCIIDDREDVWRHAANLIQVRPYSFFQSTGDINAPPPLVCKNIRRASKKRVSVAQGALFPCGDNMVCIIDDREDVWRHAANLIQVRPYSFFQSTGDINAPPPLDEKSKQETNNVKNGDQKSNQEMPTLDDEPEKKEETKDITKNYCTIN